MDSFLVKKTKSAFVKDVDVFKHRHLNTVFVSQGIPKKFQKLLHAVIELTTRLSLRWRRFSVGSVRIFWTGNNLTQAEIQILPRLAGFLMIGQWFELQKMVRWIFGSNFTTLPVFVWTEVVVCSVVIQRYIVIAPTLKSFFILLHRKLSFDNNINVGILQNFN